MTFCANCETEAVKQTVLGTPLCSTCATAYEWGQASPNDPIVELEDKYGPDVSRRAVSTRA